MTYFEKAIHSVALKFIQTTLSYFNFGASLCNWITIFSILCFVLCPRQTFYQMFLELGVAVDKVILHHLIFFYFVRKSWQLKLKRMKILLESNLTPNINYYNM